MKDVPGIQYGEPIAASKATQALMRLMGDGDAQGVYTVMPELEGDGEVTFERFDDETDSLTTCKREDVDQVLVVVGERFRYQVETSLWYGATITTLH